jgi:anti-sigma-K factor RskA
MKPLLQHLENESLLLLYLAGELPAEDRSELELMLQRDGGLRTQLESMRSAQDCSFSALATLDAAEPLRSAEPAMRRINRSTQQWWIDQLARPAEAPVARSMIPVIGWSVGTAVAALLVFCIWWGLHTSDTSSHLAVTPPTPDDSGVVAVDGSSPEGSPDNVAPDSNAVQIATVDSSPQRLGELESVVSEDFTRE